MIKKPNAKKILIYILIWTIPVAIGTYFRTYPLRSFHSDESTEKASVYVIAKIKKNINDQVNNQHPNMPESGKSILSKQLFDKFIKSESKNIQNTINKLSKNIEQSKSIDGESYVPYLLASDSFYYFDLTKNILKTGTISDATRGSKYLNKKMLAPAGHWEPLNLHPYVGFYLYSFLKAFDHNIPLMYAIGFTPIVITAISLMIFILACTILNCEKLFIFIGSIFFVLGGIFVKRSTFGWYDNDPYNILFPLLILTLIFFALKHLCRKTGAIKFTDILIPSLSIALIFMLYSFFWQGWVFLFSIICVSGISIFLINKIIFKDPASIHNVNKFFFFLVFFSFVFIGISFGFSDFFKLFKEGWVALKNFMTPQLSIWPDLYLSVSELKKTSFLEIIDFCGGKLFFTISIFGLTCSIIGSYFKKASIKFYQILIILLFLIGSIVITLGAQRFAILCLVPLSLGFPLGLQYIYQFLLKIINITKGESKKLKNVLRLASIVIILSTIFIPIISINKNMPFILNRIYNDTWDKVMRELNERTPKNSIITTWWPPGHFIKSMADRRVTFDGATINVPQAYWIANIFLSKTEEEALGILRMLDDSGNEASEYLDGLGLPNSTTVLLLKDITKEDAEAAYKKLSSVIKNEKAIERLLDLTHKEPPPAYLLLYNEFVDNNIQLSFLGNWNFKEIEKINSNPSLLKNIPDRKSQGYIDFLWELAGGPTKYSGKLTQIARDGEKILFPEGLEIDLTTKECRISSAKYGKGIPRSIFYLSNEEIVEKKMIDSNLNYSVVLFKDGELYNSILMDRSLAESLLIKLFFFDAKGLKYIKLFLKESDMTKRTQISVFAIDWKKFEDDLRKGRAR